MASRRTTPRKTSGKSRKGKTRSELKKLLKNAQAEIEKLLKGDQAGTLTRRNLRAGLEEIKADLVAIVPLECG
jgi:predicted ribonuclease toxin of YeeF-YezG toxin-antitoxin module